MNYFLTQGLLIKEHDIYGICFQYMTRDDYSGACECTKKMFPVLTAIETGTMGGPKPVDQLKCDKLDSIPAPPDT